MLRSRRKFIQQFLTGTAVIGMSPKLAKAQPSMKGRVIVVGGGFGGATAAKYIRMWDPDIKVTLIEKNHSFVSCPLSNRVISGVWDINKISRDYSALQDRYGVNIVQDEAVDIDPVSREVVLRSNSKKLSYDKLILAPGVDFSYRELPGLDTYAARRLAPHAWKAGAETMLLRQQIENMPDGGVVAISIPLSPYRCPPGPYERACQIAYYLKENKPRSKLIVLDANENIQSKKTLFSKAWADRYPGIIDYVPLSRLIDVDTEKMTLKLDFEDVKADVVNVIPPQEAGSLAKKNGLVAQRGKWCEVDFLTYESKIVSDIHVIGDSVLASPKMPKSAHMANQHAKVCAAAICALIDGRSPNPEPMLSNTCYSFVGLHEVIHVAAVYAYDSSKKTMAIVPGASGTSEANEAESLYAEAWAHNIWADMLA